MAQKALYEDSKDYLKPIIPTHLDKPLQFRSKAPEKFGGRNALWK